MDNFCFYQHESATQETPPCLLQNTAVFQTCLRKIYFFEHDEKILSELKEQGARFFQGAEALQQLMEILCGLHSRVLGETEIFGQFKKFLISEEAKKIPSLQNKELIRFLFETVKEVRESHIKEWGVQSYGSLIRKIAKPHSHVSLIGFGHLAQELVPWLKTKSLTIHVRRPEAVATDLLTEVGDARVVSLQDQEPFSHLTIIAAPVDSSIILRGLPKGSHVVDCRALGGDLSSLRGIYSGPLTELQDLFEILAGESRKLEHQVPVVKACLQDQVSKFKLRVAHRPMGWDDLCA